jgi:hypothetical protein
MLWKGPRLGAFHFLKFRRDFLAALSSHVVELTERAHKNSFAANRQPPTGA